MRSEQVAALESERGAATVEWTALILLVATTLAGVTAVAPVVDGRSLGSVISHALVCAVEEGCDDGDRRLAAAYGDRDAALIRRYAPNLVYEPGELQLPVDYRHCRSPRCAGAPDDPELDAHRTTVGGHPATAFTRLVRDGGETFLQYWLYFPDSNTSVLGSDRAWDFMGPAVRLGARIITGEWGYPGYHRDDWESYQVRLDEAGMGKVRASAHAGYQWCKQAECRNRWGPGTGWTRVSRGSHAGHIPLHAEPAGLSLAAPPSFPTVRLHNRYSPLYPGAGLHERTTTAAGLRLIPLERLERDSYRPLDPEISPPWGKEVYEEPLSDSG